MLLERSKLVMQLMKHSMMIRMNWFSWKVENMRYPINSTKDDFGIIIEKELERGYFSSSREGDDENQRENEIPRHNYLLRF